MVLGASIRYGQILTTCLLPIGVFRFVTSSTATTELNGGFNNGFSKSTIPTECPKSYYLFAGGPLKVIAIFPATDGNFGQILHFRLFEVTLNCQW